MHLCLTKLSVILEIDPYVISLDFFFFFFSMKKLSQRLQIFKTCQPRMILQIKEIVRVYANSKYLDRNVQWVLFILAEYRFFFILFQQDCMLKKIKFVLICRNPKDVVVSFYNHTKGIKNYQYSGKFENYFEMFLRGEGKPQLHILLIQQP